MYCVFVSFQASFLIGQFKFNRREFTPIKMNQSSIQAGDHSFKKVSLLGVVNFVQSSRFGIRTDDVLKKLIGFTFGSEKSIMEKTHLLECI